MIIRAEIEEKHRQRVETEVSPGGTEILLLVTLNCGNITKHSASVGQCYSPTLLRPNDTPAGRGTGTLSNILANLFYNEQSSGEKVAREYLRPESSSEQHH